jgi:ADP-ribose pyrophosphatase YjhB (NUDIX family)
MPEAAACESSRHCHRCGQHLRFETPREDRHLREVCGGCGTVQYDRPRNVVGTVSFAGAAGDRVLLCRRAIEPRVGLWTLPAGFMELGETIVQGARRETEEETGANVEVIELLAMIDVLPAAQVHLLFRARMGDSPLLPGPETLEARLFEEHEVPWDRLAFRTVEQVLRHYFQCRRLGSYSLLVDRID